MKNFVIVALFSLGTIAFFAGFSNFGIPQIEPAPPPQEEKFDLGAMTMEQFVALGERVYDGKGTCTLCHNPVGGRAPLLEEAAAVAVERLAEEDYAGDAADTEGYLYESMVAPSADAADAEGYLYESMVAPSAYVVPGFGKTGTDDTVSPMPNMKTGSIGLSEAEMRAIIAYLQNLGGFEVTVEIPSDVAPPGEEEEADEGERRPLFATPEDAIVELGCGACHVVADEEGDLGPDLSAIGASRDRDYLRRAILEPNAELAENYDPDLMPDDYGEQLYATELEMLVQYLAELRP
jgi:mono/diheme cytochrome c family protein